MRPRRRLIPVLAAIVFVLNMQVFIGQIALRSLSLIREQALDDFTCTNEATLLLGAFLFAAARRRRRHTPGRRRAWAWPRPQNWFDHMLFTPILEPLWKPNFRMRRQTFDELCQIVGPDLSRQETRMRKPVSVEKRVAVGLWRLSTGNSYRSCGLQFGLGKSTAKVICMEFEQALCARKNMFIRFPVTPHEVQGSIDDFEEEFGFPQIVGAIDGSHIEINSPPRNHEDFFNRKHYYSLNLQAIVNSKLEFQHISVGYPGSIHDARVLRLSRVFDRAENRQILAEPVRIINGAEIRPMLAGDSAYPLRNWLLKPFPDRGNLLPHERRFNAKFSAMRAVVERAFGMLKNRWRILLKKIEQHYQSVPRTVTAACILHNFCLMHGDGFDEDDRHEAPPHCGRNDDDPVDGDAVREVILAYLIDREII